jgi:hypothetical protein
VRLFDGVRQATKKIEVVGCQPIKIHLRGTYHKSTNENASSGQPCVYVMLLGTEAASPPWFFRYGSYISPESASSQLPGNRASFLIGPYNLIFSAPIKFLSSHHIAI